MMPRLFCYLCCLFICAHAMALQLSPDPPLKVPATGIGVLDEPEVNAGIELPTIIKDQPISPHRRKDDELKGPVRGVR